MKSVRIAKIGKNAITSTNPNDFIFNSSLNTFSIIDTKTRAVALANTGSSEAYTTVAHGKSWYPFAIPFVKYANNTVGTPGSNVKAVRAYSDFHFSNFAIDSTNARFGYINNTGGNYSPSFKCFITEAPLSGTPVVSLPTNKVIRIAKTGRNALTDTNPNNIVFDSRYKSLKYYSQGSKTVTVSTSTPAANVSHYYTNTLSTHSLGYYPFFSFSLELSGNGTLYNGAFSFADAGFWGYDFVYATTSSLVFRSERGNYLGGIPMGGHTIKIYWRIFSFDLGF